MVVNFDEQALRGSFAGQNSRAIRPSAGAAAKLKLELELELTLTLTLKLKPAPNAPLSRSGGESPSTYANPLPIHSSSFSQTHAGAQIGKSCPARGWKAAATPHLRAIRSVHTEFTI